MSQSIRFIGLAILAWAAVRAVSLGLVPGMEALAFDAAAAQPDRPLPPIQPTLLPPIEPIGLSGQAPQLAMGYGPPAAYAAPYPIYVPVAAAARGVPPQIIYLNPPPSEPREIRFEPQQLALAAPAPVSVRQSTPSFEPTRRPPGLDRLSLTGWATLRNEGGPDSLAGGGMLGGSEAGARILWRFAPALAASLRSSAPVNSQRGAEAALGIRYQPFAAWPVALTLERRQGFRDYGRNAFALFAEGGVYGRPFVWNSTLDGYFQAGVVDLGDPIWFADGQIAVSRPVWRNLSAGLGAWGGAQPGINRFDVGPRLSLRIGDRMRAHLDYRFNLAGSASPGSGAVMTVAGDF